MKNEQKTCVYTVMLGRYEVLNEQPMAANSAIPFICLTDDPELTSTTWKIVQVPAAFKMDPIRSQRILKICPHLVGPLDGFDRSLYIDNTVVLQETPEKIIERYATDQGLGLPTHSFRDSVMDEFIEVAHIGLDDQSRIFEQLNHYLSYGEPALDERPFWTAILLRDHGNALVRAAMERWAFHVLRYSRRDQLSFNTAIREVGMVPRRWEVDNHASWFHTWPLANQRDRFGKGRDPKVSIIPPHVQIRRLEKEVEAARSSNESLACDLDIARREGEGLVDSLAARVRQVDALAHERVALDARCQNQATMLSESLEESASLRHQLDAALAAASGVEQRIRSIQQQASESIAAFQRSTSWRITAPLRRLKELLVATRSPSPSHSDT